jgi:hypothetical protein
MSIEAQKQIRENTMVLSTFYLLPFVFLFLQCLSYDDVAECFYALVLLNAESLFPFSAETCNIVHGFVRKQCVENTSAGRFFPACFFLSFSSCLVLQSEFRLADPFAPPQCTHTALVVILDCSVDDKQMQ